MPTPEAVRIAPALPTCTCAHTAAGHYARNAYDSEQGIKPCWVCSCRDYAASSDVHLAEALHAWLIETYASRVDQRAEDWERDTGALLAIIDGSVR